MYHALITRRYLTSKIMPLLSAVAVALCTAMVLIVWSVMGGFLDMLLGQGKSMIGDVSITVPIGAGGLAHYEDLMARLEADPAISATSPTIETMALAGLPVGDSKPVMLIAVEPERHDAVTGFYDLLYWRPAEGKAPDNAAESFRVFDRRTRLDDRYLEDGKALAEADPRTGAERPAVVIGIQLSGTNQRIYKGYVLDETTGEKARQPFIEPRLYFNPTQELSLTLLPLTQGGAPLDPVERRFPIANEFQTGMYEADANWVIARLDVIQRLLKMDEAEKIDPDWRPGRLVTDSAGNLVPELPPVIGIEPARVTNILIAAAEGYTPNDVHERATAIYGAFAEAHPGEVPALEAMVRYGYIYIWENKPGLSTFIQAVKKETALVLVLFMIISLVAVVLIFSIFWSMVSEKTKDIGILRALGASKGGVLWLFLRYGLAIGVVGSMAGGLLALIIVTNINPIHTALGERLGLVIWDPSVYYFNEIPNEIDPVHAVIVLLGGVLASLLGALLPAMRAASMDPVRSLRFE